MKNTFKKNKDMDEIVTMVEKDNTLLEGLNVDQLEILSKYLGDYEKYLIEITEA